ncbi:hypothetical protein ACLB0R_05255 [Sphingomonas sp. GlSt437]
MKVATMIAAAVLASISIGARAGQIEDARTVYAKGDFATAFRLGHQAAEKGDGSAQAMLGYMYHDGEGVARNYVLALMWFQLATAQLDKEARLQKDNKLFDLSRDTAQAMDLTASLMTPAEIAEAHHKAYQCQANGFKSCDP